MTSESFGKKILKRQGYIKNKGLGKRSNGIIQPLYSMAATFNGKNVTIFKAIYNIRDRKRWKLISKLQKLLELNGQKGSGRKIFLPAGLTLQKLLNSK